MQLVVVVSVIRWTVALSLVFLKNSRVVSLHKNHFFLNVHSAVMIFKRLFCVNSKLFLKHEKQIKF